MLLNMIGNNAESNLVRNALIGDWWMPHSNLAKSSEDPNTWSKSEMTVPGTVTTSPAGTLSAKLCLETAVDNQHFLGRFAPDVNSVAENSTVTVSVYVKQYGRNFIQIAVRKRDGTYPNASFDLSNGSVIAQTSGITPSITPSTNGFYLCSITYDVGTGTNAIGGWVKTKLDANTLSFLGDTSKGLYIWGLQIAEGPLKMYSQADDFQTIYDRSGKGNHGVNGSTSSTAGDTNDMIAARLGYQGGSDDFGTLPVSLFNSDELTMIFVGQAPAAATTTQHFWGLTFNSTKSWRITRSNSDYSVYAAIEDGVNPTGFLTAGAANSAPNNSLFIAMAGIKRSTGEMYGAFNGSNFSTITKFPLTGDCTAMQIMSKATANCYQGIGIGLLGYSRIITQAEWKRICIEMKLRLAKMGVTAPW